ncbi:p-aminobenzoyl-glutamate hydrolase subunit B [Planctomycetes bacterium Pan216]|uniref:p-aminobenzoyl-glutamate hydrolase subunit B n=1 Tax=Kolteria novifilia TaxID=2527975 RepID=A0A518B9T3_9BACT|nr:p-aminobenzoyl-glutamate hydrolase subunit B [Planctomycetes bacterium Pan216]
MSLGLLLVGLIVGADRPNDGKAEWTETKRAAAESIEARKEEIASQARRIWELAELAFQERKSSTLLADALESSGFEVERGVAGMETAFVATFGKGKPVIALLAEFDALPGLSQRAEPYRKEDPRRDAGHGCGHNLFGVASVGAAIAVKEVMVEKGLEGTLRVYGCPAEEGGGGKSYLVREGLFDDVDAALHWHPSSSNDAGPRTTLAVIRFRVRFKGKSAHASAAPEQGRSALDAIELMSVGVNFLREHIPSDVRIHHVITEGGKRPNVVPENAEAWYYIRAPRMATAKEVFARVRRIADGAALMTDTKSTILKVTGAHEILPNEPLARLVDGNFRLIGPPQFSEEERSFAQSLRESLGLADDVDLREGARGPVSDAISGFREHGTKGSTDVGDVSWSVPTAGALVATAPRGVPLHSWGFVASAGSSIGVRGAVTAAKVLALSAIDLFEQPKLLDAGKEDFRRRKGTAPFEPLLESGPPPKSVDP